MLLLKLNTMLFLTIFGIVILTFFCGGIRVANATIIDSRTWTTNTDCGGDCFGATYSLVVTDRNDGVNTTFDATLTVNIGTYTGSMTYIGAVDVKVGDVIAPVSLASVSGPAGTMTGGTGAWTTSFIDGQAATNCLNGSGGFLCSYDTGTNTEAPTGNNRIYTWKWNFSLNSVSDYQFGHLGVNYTVADDSGRCSGPGQVTGPDCLQDGQNLSISTGGMQKVPEPSSMLLLGLGLVGTGFLMRRWSMKPRGKDV